jgi:hypothetical protein
MRRLKVLFYLEPVDYCDSPLRLGGWLSFFSQFAQRSHGAFDSFLGGSPMIVDRAGDAFTEAVPINTMGILGSVDFDRRRYSRDLCTPGGSNHALTEALVSIRDKIDPDVVISPSENQYLKQIFGPDRVMFTELGPLPRYGLKPSIYLDPFGHQIGSALERFALRSWPTEGLDGFHEAWETLWSAPMREKARNNGLADWFGSVVGERPALLAVLQPSDWINYEGVGPQIDPVSLLRKIAAEAPAGWAVVPQWHAADKAPTDDLAADLSRQQPNILIPPEALRVGHSDEAVHYVDGVTTISSNVAVVAAINGVPLQVLGRSKFASLGGGLQSPARPALELLAFLVCRFCSPLEDWLHRDGAFAETLLRLRADPDSLFDPRGLNPEGLTAYRLA